MNALHASAFDYNFRIPGSEVEGAIYYALGRRAGHMVLVGKRHKGLCAILPGDNRWGVERKRALFIKEECEQ